MIGPRFKKLGYVASGGPDICHSSYFADEFGYGASATNAKQQTD